MSAKPAGEEGRPWDKERTIPQDSSPCKVQGGTFFFFFFIPSEADLLCEGDSARGPRVLKGHPPGCFQRVSGQNAGLVSHLERQEWAIFTFINPSANTLMDMD